MSEPKWLESGYWQRFLMGQLKLKVQRPLLPLGVGVLFRQIEARLFRYYFGLEVWTAAQLLFALGRD
jgi:hypothetical protein